MASPFPGMDPYLEDPAYWSGFHSTMNIYLRHQITPLLPAGYYAEVEQVVWLEEDDERTGMWVPDVYVADRENGGVTVAARNKATRATAEVTLPKLSQRKAPKHVEIRDSAKNRVITVIELLSPSNKRNGIERDQFLLKRREYLQAGTNLVEIDLLREGERLPLGRPKPPRADYYALVSRAATYPRAQVWAWTIRDPMPRLPIPLKPEHADVVLDLRESLDRVYQDADYTKRMNYKEPPHEPLSTSDATWSAELLQKHFRRRK